MLWLEIKVRLLTLVARFLLYFTSFLWALHKEWSFKLHQKIGWIVVDWYHKYKHIHKMELWDDNEDDEAIQMDYILNIYQKDSRTKSGRRIVGSYQYNCKDRESMNREIKTLYLTCKESDGYTFEVLETNKIY